MLRAVIFDMDGVVIDSHPIHKKAWKQFLQSVGKDVTEEDLSFVLEGGKRSEILRHYLGELSEEQITEYGIRKETLFRQQCSEMKTLRGMPAMLAEIASHGILIGLASSASRDRVSYILDHLFLLPYFSAVVTGDDVERGKPDPKVFLLASEKLGVETDCALAVDDAVLGVQAAKAAGMKCLGIADEHRKGALLAAGADHVLPHFEGVQASDLEAIWLHN